MPTGRALTGKAAALPRWLVFALWLLGLALACRSAPAVGPAAAARTPQQAAAESAGKPAAPSTLPQVRVVQATHTAPIDQIRADARFERLVTASSDKTLRIWRLDDLQPLRTVALPAEPGREGTPYSIALSADGQRIYAAGYTGWDWHGGAHIYVIDAALGRIVGTLGRFKGEVVTALDLSPDGRRLAVGLGRGGLVVIDARTGRRQRADAAYAGPVSFVHHAADGRLASASDDGCLRVYAADGTLVHRQQFPPLPAAQRQCTGGRLGGVRFSPDGRWLAVGHRDQATLGLFNASALQPQWRRTLRVTDPPHDAQQQSLCCVAWSPDSQTLFFNGTVDGDQATPLYRLRGLANPANPANGQKGQAERWNIGRQQFSNMLPMPDGSVVFATSVPSIERVGPDGRIARRADGGPYAVAPDNIDFHRTRRTPASFLLAADGLSISMEAAPGRWFRADPLHADAGQVLTTTPAAAPGMQPARRSGALRVDTAADPGADDQPVRVGGRPVALGGGERVRSWAVHARLPIAALGTQWRLWLVDAMGRPMPGWQVPPFLPAPAYHTVISEDGRWVVVAVGDGTVHWFDVASGQERLGLFVHANAVDWVAWRPDGYYASSPQGDRFVGWLVNRGPGESPDFFRAVQFERALYRPDLLRTALAEGSAQPAAARALANTLADLAPPRVQIESITPGVAPDSMVIRFSAESTGRPIAEVGVFIDGIPVLPVADRAVGADHAHRLMRSVSVRSNNSSSSAGIGSVRVEAETARSLGIDESLPLRAPAAKAGQRPGTLWLVAVGVERFDQLPESMLRRLPFATHDAAALAQALAVQRGKVFADVRIRVVSAASADKPTKANILARLRELDQMQPDDTAVVFLASHGVATAAEYYFVTQDASLADMQRLLAARASGARLGEGALASLLSGTELTAALRRLPGRRVLVLDTCRAAALGSSDPYSLIKRSASAQLAVLSAARSDESSYDAPGQAGGIFTLALVQALSGKSRLAPGPVTLRNAFDAAVPEVQTMLRQLQDKMTNPKDRAAIRQTPVLTALPSLQSSVLAFRAP